MAEIVRFGGGRDCFELEFLKRETTPRCAVKLGT